MTTRTYKAITVDALWAWAIARGIKRVENRTWKVKHRGPLAIHAGTNTRRDSVAREILTLHGHDPPPDPVRGAVVAIVDVVDVVLIGEADPTPLLPGPHSLVASDPLAWGPVCWILDNARELTEPVPAIGRQTLFPVEIPTDVLAVALPGASSASICGICGRRRKRSSADSAD